MKLIYIQMVWALLFIAPITVMASSLQGRVVDSTNEPLPNAALKLMNEGTGTFTDAAGVFTLEMKQSADRLIVHYIGFEADTLDVHPGMGELTIRLRDSRQSITEVEVSAKRAGLVKNRLSVAQTEKIDYSELCRAACCNLSESFQTNPSVDVSYSDAATGAKQVRLLGLPGTYVQMLSENVPSFRGAASQFGLDYVPAPWMESIQVSKGASSVRNGYESVTGQINVEYKKPQLSDPLTLNLFGAHTGRWEANADGAWKISPELATGLFVHYSQDKIAHDGNGDGFLDLPLTEQAGVFNRWYYKKDQFVSQIGARFVYETRRNGQIAQTEESNPGRPLYEINLLTRRTELFAKNGYVLNEHNNQSIALVLGGSFHDQQSGYGNVGYNLIQNNLYANLLFETDIKEHHRISTGISFNLDYTKQLLTMKTPTPHYLPHRTETVPGVFVEYTWKPIEQFSLMAGLRGDYHNEYGLFFTPRLHLKYNPIEQIHLRASVGKGYRSVNPLVENSFLFASNRANRMIIDPNLNMEEALNWGGSATGYIPIAGKELQVTLEYYQTDFMRQAVVDVMSQANAVSIYNLDGRSYSRNIQIEASYPLFRGFDLRAAWRWTDTKTTYNGVLRNKPLTNRYKGLLTASYSTPLKKWQFDITTQFNGGGDMPTPHAANPLWESTFRPYTILGAQVTKYFRNWNVYIGGENLTNFRQPGPIIDAANPFGETFDATMIWGPIHGIKIFAGVRWNL